MAVHVALIAVAINLPGRSPDLAAARRPRVDIVFYAEPAPQEPPAELIPEPVPERVPTPAPKPEPEPPRERPAPEIVARTVVEPAEPAEPVEPPPKPAAPPAVADEPPTPSRPEVRTRVFAAAEPKPAETRVPSSDREVRANVFGGSGPAGETVARPERRAVTGIFTTNRGAGDLVVAAAPRAVSPAGFGDGSAAGRRTPAAGAARGARVERGSFGDSVIVAPSSRPRELPRPDPDIPVEIVSKPKPVYTEEARRLGIEGEVVLEVTFGASGKLSIHRIVEGLGHGLDEAAVVAARSIAFTPARRGGRPVDFVATLRVVFQLA